MGVPKEVVHMITYEAPKSNWATGGKLHSEKRNKHPHYKYA